MKKTPRVDRYDPIIYPRKLWVTGDVIGLNKIFKFNKLDNTKEECASAYDELVEEYNTTKDGWLTCPVTHKATGEYGALVIIMDSSIEAGGEAHEAVHVADYIYLTNQECIHSHLQIIMNNTHTWQVGQQDA